MLQPLWQLGEPQHHRGDSPEGLLRCQAVQLSLPT
jgi:hypothetical protein